MFDELGFIVCRGMIRIINSIEQKAPLLHLICLRLGDLDLFIDPMGILSNVNIWLGFDNQLSLSR